MVDEFTKTPSQLFLKEWNAQNELYKLSIKHHAWEEYLKSIGKSRQSVRDTELT